MTTTNAYTRQPTKQDYASPIQFKFLCSKLPKVEYFCTSANIPGVSLSTLNQQTPLKDIMLPADKLNYENLTISFMVDENLENYREIHGWMYGIGYPKSRTEFKDLVTKGLDRFPTVGKDATSRAVAMDPGKPDVPQPIGPIFADATLNVLTSKNTANIEVRFSDVFPQTLSGLNFSQTANDVDYLTASVTFKYKIYEFATKSASRTTITST